MQGDIMEHRLSQRIEGELPILVYKRGMPVATGQIQDASRRGLFVATDYADIRLNQPIQLAFKLPDQGQDCHRVLNAHVIRRSSGGLGLGFDGTDNEVDVIAELVQWLQSQSLLTGFRV
jgi:hypothetical protein|uniref:PilZ domain-containing protein n=4 Tax=Marinobacter TaxID=2742 RepID=A0A455WAB8_MARNT|nr:hypothetical protein YBY_18960 [Marinobacter nauticus]